MPQLKLRDIRAIAFCAVTILALFVASELFLPNQLAAAAVTLAYAVFILTRPRMVRVMRRVFGMDDGNWSGYYRN